MLRTTKPRPDLEECQRTEGEPRYVEANSDGGSNTYIRRHQRMTVDVPPRARLQLLRRASFKAGV
jgi:hypothetical protein